MYSYKCINYIIILKHLNKVLQKFSSVAKHKLLSLSSLCFATDEDICAIENFCNTLFKCIYNLHEEIFCLIVDHIEREFNMCYMYNIYVYHYNKSLLFIFRYS